MTKKQTKSSNQLRQHKSGAHRRARNRRNKHLRYIAQARLRNIIKNPPQQIQNNENTSLKWKIKKFWIKVQCAIGLHRWIEMSGLPNTPRFMCRKCYKKSKILWSEK